MKLLALAVACMFWMLPSPDPVAARPYGWTISASSTDPFVNTGEATFGVDTKYLWLACSDPPAPRRSAACATKPAPWRRRPRLNARPVDARSTASCTSRARIPRKPRA